MHKYIGAKIIRAEPMTDAAFTLEYKLGALEGITINERGEGKPGYHVLYPDNYHSWSPKGVFEEAYRRVSISELKLLEEDK